MQDEIKRKYLNPTPLLYLYRGKEGILNTLNSRDFNHASEIKLTKTTNETNKLTFKVPFCEDRKVDYNSCELLTKFEGEYYIIKNVVTDRSNLSSEVNAVHESEALKGIYCIAQKCIGATPQEMFNSVISSTRHPIDLGIKWGGCDIDINIRRHLITEDEASVYENFVSIAKVFNGTFVIYNDENDQRWFYLRTKPLDKGRKFKSELDLKNVNVEYDSSEIIYRLYPTGYSNEYGIQLDVQEATQNKTKQSIIENYSYAIAMGVPTAIIDKEPQYQQLKTLSDENYINADDLWTFSQEELAKCCVPKLDATISITDLSAYVDSSLDDLDLMEKILCIDKDINFVFECQIVGIDKDYDNPLQTELTISNLIRYDTDYQNIEHTVDTVDKIVSTNPWDTDGNTTGDGKPYVPMCNVKDGDHFNQLWRNAQFESLATQNAENIKLEVKQTNVSQASINLTANEINSTVEEMGVSMSQIKQTSSQINLSVKTLGDNTEIMKSEIDITADKISSKVSKGEVGSLIEQYPNSVKLSWNHVSKKAELNDEDGIIMSDTNNKYYTKIGYSGSISLFAEGMEHPYHCLTYTNTKYGIDSNDADESPAYATVPIPSMFKNINEDDIQVSVAVAKNFPPSGGGQYIAYGHGTSWEVKNGYIYIYVVSTWREYDENGIKNDEGAVGGYMDIQYTISA